MKNKRNGENRTNQQMLYTHNDNTPKS